LGRPDIAEKASLIAPVLVRDIIDTHDDQSHTAHRIAAETEEREQLPERVRSLLGRRDRAIHAWRAAYRNWCE